MVQCGCDHFSLSCRFLGGYVHITGREQTSFRPILDYADTESKFYRCIASDISKWQGTDILSDFYRSIHPRDNNISVSLIPKKPNGNKEHKIKRRNKYLIARICTEWEWISEECGWYVDLLGDSECGFSLSEQHRKQSSYIPCYVCFYSSNHSISWNNFANGTNRLVWERIENRVHGLYRGHLCHDLDRCIVGGNWQMEVA